MSASSISSIFHPSDFSFPSQVAFQHALKLALLAQANLSILHVSASTPTDWTDFPGVRETLTQWGQLPADSSRNAVLKLGINVQKIIAQDSDPVRACLHQLTHDPADLIVLATHQHEGRMAWLHRAVAEPLARGAHAMTLFIPHESKGFVRSYDGSLHLRSIVIPVAIDPSPQTALARVAELTRLIGPGPGVVTLVHVGDGEATMDTLPETNGWSWNQQNHKGPVVETILNTAREVGADLIVMTTQGRNGFLDLLRGTTTERVLRESSCPVLAIPTQRADR